MRELRSEVLLQWYLTLRRSDAMGTCKVNRRPGVHHHPCWLPLPQPPAFPGTPGGGQATRSQPGDDFTDLSPFPLPITVLKVSERLKRFGEVQKVPGFTKGFFRLGFRALNVLPRLPRASVCRALLRGCQSASGTTTRAEFAIQSASQMSALQTATGRC